MNKPHADILTDSHQKSQTIHQNNEYVPGNFKLQVFQIYNI